MCNCGKAPTSITVDAATEAAAGAADRVTAAPAPAAQSELDTDLATLVEDQLVTR